MNSTALCWAKSQKPYQTCAIMVFTSGTHRLWRWLTTEAASHHRRILLNKVKRKQKARVEMKWRSDTFPWPIGRMQCPSRAVRPLVFASSTWVTTRKRICLWESTRSRAKKVGYVMLPCRTSARYAPSYAPCYACFFKTPATYYRWPLAMFWALKTWLSRRLAAWRLAVSFWITAQRSCLRAVVIT